MFAQQDQKYVEIRYQLYYNKFISIFVQAISLSTEAFLIKISMLAMKITPKLSVKISVFGKVNGTSKSD